jgi:hypothetical protein
MVHTHPHVLFFLLFSNFIPSSKFSPITQPRTCGSLCVEVHVLGLLPSMLPSTAK